MYIRTYCPNCKQANYHGININVLAHTTTFSDRSRAIRYLVENIDVDDTISEEDMAVAVLRELEGHVYNGITTRELCHILMDCFGVVAAHCCDLVQKLKIDLDMYCPDRRHLYFVSQ